LTETKGKNNFTMSGKTNNEDGTLSLRFEAVVQIPLFNLLSIFYETELYPLWIPFCDKARVVMIIIEGVLFFKILDQRSWESA
jgi:hypothetical protein